jgi:hypothetical protein
MMFAGRKSGAFASIFIVGSHATRRSLSLASHQVEHRKVESDSKSEAPGIESAAFPEIAYAIQSHIQTRLWPITQ